MAYLGEEFKPLAHPHLNTFLSNQLVCFIVSSRLIHSFVACYIILCYVFAVILAICCMCSIFLSVLSDLTTSALMTVSSTSGTSSQSVQQVSILSGVLHW